MWLKAHWEVRLAAVHVEAQREEARYTVLGALSRSPAAPTTTLGPLSTPKSTENTGPFVGMPFVWVCGLKHPGNPELRFKPRFSRFLFDVTRSPKEGYSEKISGLSTIEPAKTHPGFRGGECDCNCTLVVAAPPMSV